MGGVGCLLDYRLGNNHIGRSRNLDIGALALAEGYTLSHSLYDRGVIGKLLAECCVVGGSDGRRREYLWCLYGSQC